MKFIKNTLVYILLLVFDVKTTFNETEELESCVGKIGANLVDSNEDNSNLLKLIDQSTVILKAFCSENLINFIDDDDDSNNYGDDFEENDMRGGKSFASKDESFNNGIESVDNDDGSFYSDDYFYKTVDERKLKTLMTFAPLTVYKGVHILRQLELFNNQEYFQIKG